MRRTVLLLLALAVSAPAARAQGLADYDYENLAFRGMGVDVGRIWPSKVDPTGVYSLRFDLGYLGPAVRIVPSLSYWSSRMRRSELARLAERLEQLPPLQEQGVTITAEDLGVIDWSDLSLSVDAHFVWTTPLRLFTFVGLGGAVHLLNGRGTAIDDTFIEDLLDTVSAGIAVFAGLEYPLADRVRIYGEARYTMLSDLSYPGLRIGGALMLPPREPVDPASRRRR
jgi:hypothetical protein